MKGIVLNFGPSGDGLIRGEDGNRYEFIGSEFKSRLPIKQGLDVDFDVINGRATAIYALSMKGSAVDRISSLATDASSGAAMNSALSALKAGPKDKVGLGVATLSIISLFLPFIHVPWLGTVSLVETGWGKFLLAITLVTGALCYIGAARRWIVLASLSFAAVFLVYAGITAHDLSSANEMATVFMGKRNGQPEFNLMNLLSFGFYSTLLMAFVMLGMAFVREPASPSS